MSDKCRHGIYGECKACRAKDERRRFEELAAKLRTERVLTKVVGLQIIMDPYLAPNDMKLLVGSEMYKTLKKGKE